MVFPISKGNAFNISLNGFPIAKLHSCRYLGLHIDDELTWKSHIDVIYTKLVKFIGIFYKLRNKLPQTVLRTVYFASVYPHIAYGIELYANTAVTHLNKLLITGCAVAPALC